MAEVFTTKRAAEYCGLAEQTLRNLLHDGHGPVRYKQGRKNAFFASDLDKWLEGRIAPLERAA
ncbi:helix-turn-helix domain-containing protein [Microbacterium sp. MPKO10]|uniref:helix-turn-helix domain-containing protein n=1 Tax=Microbacterium sp. MPKO10 TaxID=2989818 RepID=UPI00223636D7|nr:helix-turn-helix domain-containing protein [Microbacterium sp. MPKO10]MCW4458155.1 helix-turn-helix domain-containing protein [Microbacterium sp. MPKO10]